MSNYFTNDSMSSDFSFCIVNDENIDPNSIKDNNKLQNNIKYNDNKLNKNNFHNISINPTERQFGRDITIKAQNNYINNKNNLFYNKNSLKVKKTNEIIMTSFLNDSSLSKKNYNSQIISDNNCENLYKQNLNIYYYININN